MPLGMPKNIFEYTLRQIKQAITEAKKEKGGLKKLQALQRQLGITIKKLEEIRNRKEILKENKRKRVIIEASDALTDLMIYLISRKGFDLNHSSIPNIGKSGRSAREFREKVRRACFEELQRTNGDFIDYILRLVEEIRRNEAKFIDMYRMRREIKLTKLIKHRDTREKLKRMRERRPMP
jgi:hypothetical protein